jgi:molybdopterin/thiamine biosynthesis adenylyltransferase
MPFSVAMSSSIHAELTQHLLRPDAQEDLCFALWTPSDGPTRTTALVHTALLPLDGEREVHGNASFHPAYIERVARRAIATGSGIAFLHSHLGPGWQGMSVADVIAERERLAGVVAGLTDQPLVGLTLGTDGAWSARFWPHVDGRRYDRAWCENVRVVGAGLDVTFCDDLVPPPAFRETFQRTVSVWGPAHQARLARLRIGIVGLGSVGAMVAETLARMGLQRFVLIDFDRVKAHNLDRLVTATLGDCGRYKVDVAAERMRAVATAASIDVRPVPFNVAEPDGYRAALDCDVIFSCVDRPRARHILNHFAYAHLIPVVDGGVGPRFKQGRFTGVDWQTQTAAPERPCLACLGAYALDDVSTEEAGMLDDPSYLAGLPDDHPFKRNENVFPFIGNLASLEVLQLVGYATGLAGLPNDGVQRYRSNPGVVTLDTEARCEPGCLMQALIATSDTQFSLVGRDLGAEQERAGEPASR